MSSSRFKIVIIAILWASLGIATAENLTKSSHMIDVCANWNKIINELYILDSATLENNEPTTTIQSACPVPRPLADLQAIKNSVYKKLKGKKNCPIEEFADLLHDEGWNQPMWLIRYRGGIYNQTIATIVNKDGITWGVRVNLPVQISGLEKSIAGDGWLNAITSEVEIKNTLTNVTERQIYNVAT
jgi:hypothetical protein